MEIKITQKNERMLKMVVDDIEPALANSIRRAAGYEVPVLAIETVDFIRNSSGLVDEILAHRLGLVPLMWPVGHYNIPSQCTCNGKGCQNCQVGIKLDKTGPLVVRAGDIEFDNPDVKPLDPNIPIVELLDGQSVKFEAKAVLGFGKMHAKWQAATVGYSQKGKKFTFTVESTCGLTAEQVIIAALDSLGQRVSELEKEIKKAL